MRTRLFHTIVVCGATLGVAAACSGDGDDGDSKKDSKDTHGCPPQYEFATGGGTTAAPVDPGMAGGGGDGSTIGCGGWPPTK